VELKYSPWKRRQNHSLSFEGQRVGLTKKNQKKHRVRDHQKGAWFGYLKGGTENVVLRRANVGLKRTAGARQKVDPKSKKEKNKSTKEGPQRKSFGR